MNCLVIGGAGFIGSNIADYYLERGEKVTVFDNFSRKGAKENAEWLKKNYSKNLELVKADIRFNQKELDECVKNSDFVCHLAAQVAVTTSVLNPREDFDVNALGTFNVLEALRKSGNNAALIFSSTNKVYGGMENIKIIERNNRYEYRDFPEGISEEALLDFHSPYGCSKGSGDQYVRDYARIYGLNTLVFRQSCIYGPRQFGIEDQGWVAWFTIASALGKKITIYGDGKQVRDILCVDDLVNAFNLAFSKIKKVKGRIYNIGGGPKNRMSLLELIGFLEKFSGKKIDFSFDEWRPGDQPVYVSNIKKAEKELGWKPKIGVEEGVKKLYSWVKENKNLFK